MPLPASYFDNYGDQGQPSRAYKDKFKRYGFQIFEAYLDNVPKEQWPKTVLDVGAADGSVIRELVAKGIDARGIESAKYIYDQAKEDVKDRIAFGDALVLIKEIPPNTYDTVFETVAQYTPTNKLRDYLQSLASITKRDLILQVHTKDYDPEPHQNQVNFLHDATWRALMSDAGFDEVGAVNDHPFWFRPKGKEVVATASTLNIGLRVKLGLVL